MIHSQSSGKEAMVPRPAVTTFRHLQAYCLTFTLCLRRLMCVQVSFLHVTHPIPNHQRERPKPPHPHHIPMADPAVLPLPSCNQLMATNL